MTRVRISDASLMSDLLGELARWPEMVAAVIGPDTIEVSVLGSYSAEAMLLALDLHLRAWEAAQQAAGRAVTIVIL